MPPKAGVQRSWRSGVKGGICQVRTTRALGGDPARLGCQSALRLVLYGWMADKIGRRRTGLARYR